MIYKIYVISDGTGQTAEQALRAALSQFEGENVDIIRKSNIRSKEQVDQLVNEAENDNALIIHTLVQDPIREELYRMARIHNVETIDLMGPLLNRLSHQFAHSPTGEPGLFRKINDSYFRQIECMQFAFSHDDGLKTHDLASAEIVIIGVSRTFKTPLSIYLAFKLWFVANIPVILGIDLPDILYKIDPERVFCLSNTPNALAALRKVRADRFGGISNQYANIEHVRKECEYAQNIYRRHPKWRTIKVTSKAVEEIASEIIALKRGK